MRIYDSSCQERRGFFAVALLVLLIAAGAFHGETAWSAEDDFQAIGKIGPKAVELDVAVEKRAAAPDAKPETVVRLKAPKETHIAAVYLAPDGETTVVIPSREIPDSLLRPGQDYVVFGPDSMLRIKSGKKASNEPKLVFYASSKKLDLDPLKIPADAPCLTLERSDKANLEVLRTKIERFAADDSFNRKVIALEPGAKLSVRLDVMGLPGAAKSRKPTDVLGAQGAKDEGLAPDRK
jgi:hypothetical protein